MQTGPRPILPTRVELGAGADGVRAGEPGRAEGRVDGLPDRQGVGVGDGLQPGGWVCGGREAGGVSGGGRAGCEWCPWGGGWSRRTWWWSARTARGWTGCWASWGLQGFTSKTMWVGSQGGPDGGGARGVRRGGRASAGPGEWTIQRAVSCLKGCRLLRGYRPDAGGGLPARGRAVRGKGSGRGDGSVLARRGVA